MTEGGHGGLPARRFGDDEVAAILRRASVRDLAGGLPSPHDPTLHDLMVAAQEVGLDPAEVRRAAALEVHERPGLLDRALGGPDRREAFARLPGARIPRDTWQVVRLAEEGLGRKGKVTESAPGVFEWLASGAGSRDGVTLKEWDGALEVTVHTDRAGYYLGLLFLGLLVWAGLSAATPVGALPWLGKLIAFLVTPPLVARPFWAAADRGIRRRLEELTMNILRLAEESDPAAPTGGAAGVDPS